MYLNCQYCFNGMQMQTYWPEQKQFLMRTFSPALIAIRNNKSTEILTDNNSPICNFKFVMLYQCLL